MVRYETERLLMRDFMEDDYNDLYEMLIQYKDDEFEPHPDISYETTREHLKRRMESDEFHAMVLKSTGKVIGNIYYGRRGWQNREVGFIVNRDFQRKGYALEALKGAISYAFSQGEHRLYGECDPRNPASWKLMEKAGMQREALLRKNIYFHTDEQGNPVWKDTYIYAVLNE